MSPWRVCSQPCLYSKINASHASSCQSTPQPAQSVLQVPLVKLDDAYYKLVDKLERLVKAAPSLKQASSLTVKGPVRFEAGVVVRWVA